MPQPGQNIIELGFNVEQFTAEQKVVYETSLQTYELLKKMDGFKINLGSSGGWTELKSQVGGLTQAQAEYDAINKRVVERVAQLNGSSKEHTQLILLETKASRELAAAKLNEEKVRTQAATTALKEIALREANEKAALKEAAAIEKSRIASASSSARPIESIPFTVNAGGENDAENIKKQGLALNELEAEQAAVSNSAFAMGQAQQTAAVQTEAATVAAVVYKDALERQTGTLAENEVLQGLYKNELASLSAQIKGLDVNSRTYSADLAKLTGQYNVLNVESKALSTTIKNQVVLSNSAVGSLDAMNARLNLLNQAYTRLSDTAKLSPLGQGFKTEIATLSDAVLKEEQALGRSQKNVGNYAGAVRTAWGGIRKIAYILPGIGIAGIFNDLFIGITKVIGAIFNGNHAITDFERHQQILGELANKAAGTMGAEVAKLELIRQKLVDTNIPAAERVRLATDYNKTAEKGNQIDTKQIDNMGQINQSIAQQILLIKDRAMARAAESVIAEKAEALFKEQETARQKYYQESLDATSGQTITTTQIVGGKKVTIGYGSEVQKMVDKVNQQRFLLEQIGKDPKVIEAKKQLDDALQSGSSLIDIDGLFSKAKKDSKGGQHDAGADAFKNGEQLRKALFEVSKHMLEDKIIANEAILNSDKSTFSERLKAAQDFYNNSAQLIILQTKFESVELDKQEEEEKRKANKDIKNKTERNKVLASIDQEYAAKRKLVAAKDNTDNLKLNETSEKQLAEIKKKNEEDLANHEKSIHEQNLEDLKNQYDQDLNAENESYLKKLTAAKGNKTKIQKIDKEHQEKLIRLQLAYQVSALEEDIKFTKETVALAEVRAAASGKQEDIDAVVTAKKKLAALENELQKDITDYKIHSVKQAESTDSDYYTKLSEKVAKWAGRTKEVIADVADLFIAGIEKQKNAVQSLEDTQQQNYDAEVQRINQSTLSEQDKAAKLIQLEAQRNAQKVQNDRKQRQLDIEKARFDKAKAIADIILNTAVAVVKALPDITEAIIIGALGVAQLAVAIATPIPAYAKGTKDHKGGDALVAEGKHAELVQEPGGKSYVVSKPTVLRNLPKHSQVIPLTVDMITEAAYNVGQAGTARLIAMSEYAEKRNGDDAWRIAKWQADQTRKALADNGNKRPVTNVKVINQFGWNDYVNKYVFGR